MHSAQIQTLGLSYSFRPGHMRDPKIVYVIKKFLSFIAQRKLSQYNAASSFVEYQLVMLFTSAKLSCLLAMMESDLFIA